MKWREFFFFFHYDHDIISIIWCRLSCKKGTLDPKKAKGKILACLRGETTLIEKGHQAALSGAVGMILCNNKTAGNEIYSVPHVLPAIHINYTDGVRVFDYIASSKSVYILVSFFSFFSELVLLVLTCDVIFTENHVHISWVQRHCYEENQLRLWQISLLLVLML